MKITFISDTHCKHNELNNDLPGGDLLIHSGDISNKGSIYDVENFCQWFDKINNYDHKIFIAGNHDFLFEDNYNKAMEIIKSYKSFVYLQDSCTYVGDDFNDLTKIWGSPWQPRFYDWAFNVDRGPKIKEKWDLIPINTDILVTHGPAHTYLDKVYGKGKNLGCEELTKKINELRPSIHVCGHIHGGRGYIYENGTHFFNASILNEDYMYAYKPINITWNKINNKITFEDETI